MLDINIESEIPLCKGGTQQEMASRFATDVEAKLGSLAQMVRYFWNHLHFGRNVQRKEGRRQREKPPHLQTPEGLWHMARIFTGGGGLKRVEVCKL